MDGVTVQIGELPDGTSILRRYCRYRDSVFYRSGKMTARAYGPPDAEIDRIVVKAMRERAAAAFDDRATVWMG